MKALADWFDNRTGYRALVHAALYENIPGGSRWRYVWGSTLVFTFSVQVITGLFLWMFYSPSAVNAWESVYHIQYEVAGGWLLRGIHHYTAQLMVVLLVLHLLQVVIDGAYKAPREVNFWLGLVLMLIVLGLSLTGYLLPWDQKGYWATKVATNLATLTPVVGEQLQMVAVGDSDYGNQTLTRFFALHAGVLPALLVGFLALHIYVFRRHGIRYKAPVRKPDRTFWPDQVFKDAVACLAVMAVVLFLVLKPLMSGGSPGADLGAPADGTKPFDARPEWYFLFLFQFLKYFPGHAGEVFGALVVPGIVLTLLFLMPIIGRSKVGHVWNVGFLGVLLAGIVLLTVFALHEDYYAAWYDEPDAEDTAAVARYETSRKFLDEVARSDASAERAKELMRKRGGVGPAGAAAMLREDPVAQGEADFQKYCASCHTHVNPDRAYRGQMAQASAPNLWRFGSREWMAGLLDADKIDGPHYFGQTKHKGQDMSKYVKGELKQWKPEQVEAAIEALYAEANLPGAKPDEGKVAKGRKLIEDDSNCAQCHSFHKDEDSDAPDLTGYASREWLQMFIANPAHSRFYGAANDRMPAFAEHEGDDPRNMLSPRAIERIVDWMRHFETDE